MVKKAAVKRKAAKRTLISPRGNKRYVRRDRKGQFNEVDDVSRSLAQDQKREAKKVSQKGQGDKGDRKISRSRKSPSKKK